MRLAIKKAADYLEKELESLRTNYPELTVAISSLKKAIEVIHREDELLLGRELLNHEIPKNNDKNIGGN